jgi:hypothetical protein
MRNWSQISAESIKDCLRLRWNDVIECCALLPNTPMLAAVAIDGWGELVEDIFGHGPYWVNDQLCLPPDGSLWVIPE